MHPLIGQDELSIEIHEVFDYDFQKVHAIVFELSAQLEHVGKVEHMSFDIAQFVRVVLLEALDYGFLIVGVLEELSEAVPGLVGGGWIDEWFYEEVIDDFARLLALASVDPEDFEKEVLVVGEGWLKPVDAM